MIFLKRIILLLPLSLIHKLSRLFILVMLCITAITPVAARNSENDKLELVSLQLKWLHSFQFAGYYAADKQGYYREEGLDVTLVEPLASNTDHLIDPVLNGDAEYGVWSSDLLNERISGKAVVLLAVIFQHSPYIVLSRKDAGISTPSDLIGRKVAIGSALVQFQAMLRNEGLPLDGVNVVARTGSIDDIIDGRADAVLNYITDQPNQMRLRGVEPAMLRPSDYGIDFYGDSLFTSEAEVEQNPERVAAFLRASLKGWEYAMSHEDELIKLILSLPGVQERGLTYDHLSYEAEQMHQLILPDLIQIGHINPGRLKHIADTYVELGLLDSDYSLEGFVYQEKSSADNILLYMLLALLLGTSVVIIIGWNWNRQLASTVAQQTQQPSASAQGYYRLDEDTADLDSMLIKSSPINAPPVDSLIIFCGAMVLILGVSVLFGWVTHNVTLIQVSAAFVPMQFNTALGFLLSGLGVLVVTRGWHGIGMSIGIVVMLIGLITLAEYILGVDLGIDQLLMKHDITLLTSHPGRMAPNTALCFLLAGAALAVQGTKLRVWKSSMVVGIFGSLILGLSLVALSGYMVDIETAYGWGELTRMAVHTSAGFIFLGMAISSLTLHRDIPYSSGLPSWFPLPVGIGVVTIVISLWQALESQEAILLKKYGISGDLPYVNEIMLVIGIVLAVALSLAAYLAQTAKNRAKQVGLTNRRLLTEIDERKVIEMALRESEERWQFALTGNRDGVWDWNVVTNKIFFSARWKEMLGFEEEEIDNSFDEWEKRVHPDDLEQALVDVDKHLNHVTPFYENEHRMLCKDGTYKWILARGKIISWTDDHRPQRMIGTHSDITEQKLAKEALELSEEMFRTMFEEAPLGVALIDSLTGHIYQVNPRFAELAGRTREEMLAFDWMSITHPDDVQEVLDNMTLLNAGKISGFNMIKRYRHPDGEYVWIHMTIAPMTVADKNCPRHLCMIEDINEQKLTEEALRRAQKMEALGNLTGGIAHDFNNLLAIVQGNLEILDRELEDNEKLQKRVTSALAGVHRGANITKKLLKFSRPKIASPTILSVNETISDMEVLIAKSVMKSCAIQLMLKDDLWLCKLDEGDFQDALLNLVINARDAMSDGGNVLIETSNKCLDEGYAKLNHGVQAGEYVQISVSDTGCGMSHKLLEQVFEPFFTTKEIGKGTGLGLSMVYGFIKRSQGHIKLYSEVGHGTTVNLYLPRVLQENSIILKPELKEQVVLPRGHEMVLVVDDEEELLDLASHFLLELGYKVLRATCGSEALEVLSVHKGVVDLLFSDIVMPGEIDGFALAAKVVGLYPDMRVLLTSGFSDKTVRLNGLAKHDVKLLDKPYSKQVLAMEVRKVLDAKNDTSIGF